MGPLDPDADRPWSADVALFPERALWLVRLTPHFAQ